MSGALYLDAVRAELRRLRDLASGALEQVGDDEFAREPGPGENSLAILVKHMAGNMRSRWTDFLTTDGEKPDRHRDTEFVLGPEDDRAALSARWNESWGLLLSTLDSLGPEHLERVVTIRGEAFTVLQAIERQLAHYAYHVGQIVQLARHQVGREWETLSIPRGGSESFNAAPEPYLEG